VVTAEPLAVGEAGAELGSILPLPPEALALLLEPPHGLALGLAGHAEPHGAGALPAVRQLGWLYWGGDGGKAAAGWEEGMSPLRAACPRASTRSSRCGMAGRKSSARVPPALAGLQREKGK